MKTIKSTLNNTSLIAIATFSMILTFTPPFHHYQPLTITPPANPVISNSYFVNKVTWSSSQGFSKFYPDGQSEAVQENSHVSCNNKSGVTYPVSIVLDFGQPWQGYSISTGAYGYGIRNWYEASNNPNQVMSFSDILSATESYAGGWFNSSVYCLRLTLIIGTNNSNECGGSSGCTNADGNLLASTVSQLQTYLYNNGLAGQITAAGGDDIEAEYDSPSLTDQFVQGYNSYGSSFLYDYGDANYQGAWFQPQVYYVSWQAPDDLAFPEMYSGRHSYYWAELNNGYNLNGSYLPYYSGVMSECTSNVWQPWEDGCSPSPTSEGWYFTYNPSPSTYLYNGGIPNYLTDIYWADFQLQIFGTPRLSCAGDVRLPLRR